MILAAVVFPPLIRRSFFLCLYSLQHMKRPTLQNKQVVILRMGFRARKVLGTFEKRAPPRVLGLAVVLSAPKR